MTWNPISSGPNQTVITVTTHWSIAFDRILHAVEITPFDSLPKADHQFRVTVPGKFQPLQGYDIAAAVGEYVSWKVAAKLRDTLADSDGDDGA